MDQPPPNFVAVLEALDNLRKHILETGCVRPIIEQMSVEEALARKIIDKVESTDEGIDATEFDIEEKKLVEKLIAEGYVQPDSSNVSASYVFRTFSGGG